MKKNIALIISIIALFSCFILFQLNTKEESIAGNKINEFLYAFELKDATKERYGYKIVDNNIYYLTGTTNDEETIYTLYRRNINENKSKKEKEKTIKNAICNLVNNYIQCSNSNSITIYNYKFEKLYETAIFEENDYPSIIPYKDTFLKLENQKLYITQNNKEKVFKELPEKTKDTFLENYLQIKDTTYLLLFELNTSSYYIYDINTEEIRKVISNNSYVYSNGFYFYNKDKHIVMNLKDNEQKEYSNLYQNDFHFTAILCDDNETLYTFNIIEDNLNITNLEKNEIQKVKIDITNEQQINSFQKNKKYLFFELAEDENHIYLIDLNKLDSSPIKIEEEIEQANQKLEDQVSKINDKHNIKINIKDAANIEFPDFTAEIEQDNEIIATSLVKIESILDKFSKEIFDDFYLNSYEGLNIYLTSTLTPSDLETQVSNPAAYSLIYKNKYIIVININESNIEKLLCHEMFHNIEFTLKKQEKNIFTKWSLYNPEGFKYNNSYTKAYTYNYTLTESDSKKIYFIDKYSHTFDTEDRARIFENICAYSENSILKDYEKLLNKGKYIEEEIIKIYPSLENTGLFNSLK